MKRAFISFDFDHDQDLKNLFVGQYKFPESPFTAADWSMKEAAPQPDWRSEAESRINRSDVVIVLVGHYTHKASGVLTEVAIAKRLGKPVYQIIGRNPQPTPVPGAGDMISWSWDNVRKILQD